jgi:hypothetical protein
LRLKSCVTRWEQRTAYDHGDIQWIQTRLQQLGFLRVRPNGVWDNASSEALRDFKVLNQLARDDVWDFSVEQKISALGLVRAETTFVGSWSESPGCISKSGQGNHLYINTASARSDVGRCDFNEITPETDGWRVRARCQVGGKNWDANIKMTVKSRELVWSSDKGTTRYFRCR